VSIEYDRSLADATDITEGLSFNLSRIIGVATASPDGLNGSVLNGSVMNATSAAVVNYEQALLSESAVLGDKEAFTDSTTSSETFTLTITTSTSLNGSALNTLALG
jgi:hypothetical protein